MALDGRGDRLRRSAATASTCSAPSSTGSPSSSGCSTRPRRRWRSCATSATRCGRPSPTAPTSPRCSPTSGRTSRRCSTRRTPALDQTDALLAQHACRPRVPDARPHRPQRDAARPVHLRGRERPRPVRVEARRARARTGPAPLLLPAGLQPRSPSRDTETGLCWLRVQLVADELQKAEFYDEFAPTPATKPGAACVAEAFGRGVDAVRQHGVQDAHETAPRDRLRPAGRGDRRASRAGRRADPAREARGRRRVPTGPPTVGDRVAGDGGRAPTAAPRTDRPSCVAAARCDDDLAADRRRTSRPWSPGGSRSSSCPLLGWPCGSAATGAAADAEHHDRDITEPRPSTDGPVTPTP